MGLTNPFFATGDLTGWTPTKVAPAFDPVVGAAYAHVTPYGCRLHTHEAPAGGGLFLTYSKITQTFTCGNKAKLSIWYIVPIEITQDLEWGGTDPDFCGLEVSVDGIPIDFWYFRASTTPPYPGLILTPTTWTKETLDLTAAGIGAGSHSLEVYSNITPARFPSTLGNSDIDIYVAELKLTGGYISAGSSVFSRGRGASIPGAIEAGKGREV
jgi:hypothetical protein